MMAVTVGGGGGDDHDGPLQHRTCPAALLQNYAHTYTHMQSLHPALHLHPPATHPGARHLCHQLTVSPPQTHPIDCHLSRHWLGLAGLGWVCVCLLGCAGSQHTRYSITTSTIHRAIPPCWRAISPTY